MSDDDLYFFELVLERDEIMTLSDMLSVAFEQVSEPVVRGKLSKEEEEKRRAVAKYYSDLQHKLLHAKRIE